MLKDSFDVFVVLYHLLMMTTALLVGTSSYGFAHDAVEMPFPAMLFSSFNHRFEFHQELDILLVLLRCPMRFRELFARCWDRI